MLVSATATAAVRATARDAGFVERGLLGGLATIISDRISVPRFGDQGREWSRLWPRSLWSRHGRSVAGKPPARNPGNAAAPGRSPFRSRAAREGAIMLEKATHLLRPSARSAVPPFMVMDVVAAAARLEALG